jgi:hypothetical protein
MVEYLPIELQDIIISELDNVSKLMLKNTNVYFSRKISEKLSVDIKYVAEKGYLNIVQFLYKKSVYNDMYLCMYAAKGGHINILEWLYKINNDISIYMCLYGTAIGGHFKVVEWLESIDPFIVVANEKILHSTAIQHNNIQLVRWLKEKNW